jgi:hypothetical protein
VIIVGLVVGILLIVMLMNDVCSVGRRVVETPLDRVSVLESDGDPVPEEVA